MLSSWGHVVLSIVYPGTVHAYPDIHDWYYQRIHSAAISVLRLVTPNPKDGLEPYQAIEHHERGIAWPHSDVEVEVVAETAAYIEAVRETLVSGCTKDEALGAVDITLHGLCDYLRMVVESSSPSVCCMVSLATPQRK